MFAMNSESKNELRELFHELKQHDREAAPSFEKTWQDAQIALQRQRWRSARRFSAIAAMLIVLGSVATVRFKPFAPTESVSIDIPWDSMVLISEWHAPTDFLLQAPQITFANAKERN